MEFKHFPAQLQEVSLPMQKENGHKHKTARTSYGGLSSRDLALNADMDAGNINEIEKGKGNPTLITILTLAEELGTDARTLLPDKF